MHIEVDPPEIEPLGVLLRGHQSLPERRIERQRSCRSRSRVDHISWPAVVPGPYDRTDHHGSADQEHHGCDGQQVTGSAAVGGLGAEATRAREARRIAVERRIGDVEPASSLGQRLPDSSDGVVVSGTHGVSSSRRSARARRTRLRTVPVGQPSIRAMSRWARSS